MGLEEVRELGRGRLVLSDPPERQAVRIGCSGWQYTHWRGDFYPAELPTSHVNLERFEMFLRALPRGYRHSVEFREPSWYDERVFELMRRHGVALCLHDMQGSASGKVIVGPFVYVRFHVGTTKYGGRYPDERLDDWAGWLAARAAEGLHVFAYFNNDTGGHAPRDAVRLRQRIFERLDPAGTIAADADTRASRPDAGDRPASTPVRTAR